MEDAGMYMYIILTNVLYKVMILTVFRGDAVFCMAAVSGDKISKAVGLNLNDTIQVFLYSHTMCVHLVGAAIDHVHDCI